MSWFKQQWDDIKGNVKFALLCAIGVVVIDWIRNGPAYQVFVALLLFLMAAACFCFGNNRTIKAFGWVTVLVSIVLSVCCILANEVNRYGHPFQGIVGRQLGQINIDDVQAINHLGMNDRGLPAIDFRLSNTNDDEIAINRGLFKVLSVWDFQSAVGKQEPSDIGEITFSTNTQAGDFLVASVAVAVKPHSTDILRVHPVWSGERLNIARYFQVATALKTSSGIVTGRVVLIEFQQDFSKAAPTNSLVPDIKSRELSTNVDWVGEDLRALQELRIPSQH